MAYLGGTGGSGAGGCGGDGCGRGGGSRGGENLLQRQGEAQGGWFEGLRSNAEEYHSECQLPGWQFLDQNDFDGNIMQKPAGAHMRYKHSWLVVSCARAYSVSILILYAGPCLGPGAGSGGGEGHGTPLSVQVVVGLPENMKFHAHSCLSQ